MNIKSKFLSEKYAIFPFVAIFYELAVYMANDAYLPAVQQIMDAFSQPEAYVKFTITIWLLGAAIVQPFMGPITDYFGRRKVMLAGVLVFILSSLICALSPNIMTLFVGRFLQGATVTAMTIAAYSTIHELFDGKKVIRILAWMYSVSLLGASFGPMLGMAVLSYGSWRVIFFTLMGWGCISFLLLYLYMPETANKDDVTSLKGAFQSYIRLVLDMNFMRPTLAFCFLFAALMAWITASPFIIMLYFHQSQLFFSIVQAIVFLGFLLGTQTIHFTMNHFDVKHIAQVGLWIGFVGGCCIIAFPLLFDNIWAIVVPMTTITFAIGFSSPILNRLSIEGSEESTGNKLSLFYILVSFFSMVGSFLVTMFNNQGVIAFLVTAFLFSCGWLIIELLFILKRSYSVRALNRK